MRWTCCLVLAIGFLPAACGDSGPQQAPPQPPPPPLSIFFGPSSPWAITQGSLPAAISNGQLVVPLCPELQPGQQSTSCWVSYVEVPLQADLRNTGGVVFKYSIAGDSPIFNYKTAANNTCPGEADLSLILHQAGDNLSGVGPYSYYRQYQVDRTPLALGEFTIARSLHDFSQWTPVYPPATANGLTTALANIGSVGFVLGGGCFAAHGISLSGGSAVLSIKEYRLE